MNLFLVAERLARKAPARSSTVRDEYLPLASSRVLMPLQITIRNACNVLRDLQSATERTRIRSPEAQSPFNPTPFCN